MECEDVKRAVENVKQDCTLKDPEHEKEEHLGILYRDTETETKYYG